MTKEHKIAQASNINATPPSCILSEIHRKQTVSVSHSSNRELVTIDQVGEGSGPVQTSPLNKLIYHNSILHTHLGQCQGGKRGAGLPEVLRECGASPVASRGEKP